MSSPGEYLLDAAKEATESIDKFGDFTVAIWFTEDREKTLPIMSLGLAGETGEVAEHIKKHIRDGKLDKDELKKELGDVIYYWARLCKYFNFVPSEIIATNVEKLMSRYNRGTLRGNGDNR